MPLKPELGGFGEEYVFHRSRCEIVWLKADVDVFSLGD